MKKIWFAVLLGLLGCGVVAAQDGVRRSFSLDANWRFFLGEAEGAYATGFADKGWRTLDVPHDWSIELTVNQQEPAGGGGGYFPTGIGWYRKAFTMPAVATNQQVRVEFDGIHMRSEVWLNGQLLGKRPGGYVSFSYDVTPYLRKGKNLLAVRVDNSQQPNSRWYTGSGIYRHVRLVISNPLHIKQWGVYVTTPEVSPEQALLKVRTSVRNALTKGQKGAVVATLLDADGKEVARARSEFEVGSGSETEVSQEIRVPKPNLWNLETPYLYTLKSVVFDEKGTQADDLATPMGIREIVYDVDKGFMLNGKQVKMHGVNLHQDAGPVGVAVPLGVWERRLQILKEGGCNAIRTAHNPMAPEFYDLCDRMGFLVMNEAFDEWQKGKVRQGLSTFFDEWYERDLIDFIHRDRNHPSVVMWSAGNEIGEQHVEGGYKVLEKLVNIFHREDPTRPVTAGCDHIAADDGATTPEFLKLLDIVGYNYVDRWRERRELYYSIDRHDHPEWKMVSTESGGLGGVRGSYSLGNNPEQLRPSYNSQMIDVEQRWKFTTLNDYVIGDFMWTGIDYYGETRWPGRGASSGLLDICGFPKDGYYFFQSHWKRTDSVAMAHLFPHWNWEGYEGKVIPVLCYSNCEALELFVNGTSYGEKRIDFPRPGTTQSWAHYDRPQVRPTTADLHVAWDVPYQPGTLKVVGKRGGKVVVTEELHTAGKPASIRLQVDKQKLTTNRDEVVHCTVEVLDAQGNLVPLANNLIEFEIEGAAKILGVENGNLSDHDPVKANKRKAFNGLCLAIVQPEKSGTFTIKARSETMESETITINVTQETGNALVL